MKGMQVGLLIACEGGEQGAVPHQVLDVEETIVVHNIKDMTLGFATLMCVIYCVNLKYPDDMKDSFEFLQRVVMKIKPDQASARVHGCLDFKTLIMVARCIDFALPLLNVVRIFLKIMV
uniref:Uncharacterized protein n=1 Tax=Poecilia latipinna TaxID=48699 RepID=A0A3B3UMB2_9TELE